MNDEQKKNNDCNDLSPEEQLRQIHRDREAARNTYQDNTAQQQMQTVGNPICCPQCSSRNLSFVSEWHKCLGLKIANYVFAFLIVAIIAFNFKSIISGADNEAMPFIVILALLYASFQIAILVAESKTHAKAICRDCGHIWLLD